MDRINSTGRKKTARKQPAGLSATGSGSGDLRTKSTSQMTTEPHHPQEISGLGAPYREQQINAARKKVPISLTDDDLRERSMSLPIRTLPSREQRASSTQTLSTIDAPISASARLKRPMRKQASQVAVQRSNEPFVKSLYAPNDTPQRRSFFDGSMVNSFWRPPAKTSRITKPAPRMTATRRTTSYQAQHKDRRIGSPSSSSRDEPISGANAFRRPVRRLATRAARKGIAHQSGSPAARSSDSISAVEVVDSDGSGWLSISSDTESSGAASARSSSPVLEYVSSRHASPDVPQPVVEPNIQPVAQPFDPEPVTLEHTPSTSPSQQQVLPPSKAIEASWLRICGDSLLLQREKRLPFTLRSLRFGFKEKCRRKESADCLTPDDEHRTVTLIYRLADSDDCWEGSMIPWLCPFCLLHGKLQSRKMLTKHLEWDHASVTFSWNETKDNAERTWKLELVLPSLTAPSPSSSPPFSEYMPLPPATLTPMLMSPNCNADAATLPPSDPPSSAHGGPDPDIAEPLMDMESLHIDDDLPAPASPTLEDTPPPERESINIIDKHSRPYPRHIFGPTAEYPYLPAKSQYGGPDVPYSCRAGGPRVYDLLGTLPLQEFGVLEWEVIDREEEIFSIEEISDEQKVLHALWARWIFSNRTKFLHDRFYGMIAFLDKYWNMIHQAAGWHALRCWLLIFVMKKFLTEYEYLQAVLHYELLAGIKPYSPDDDDDDDDDAAATR